ncbi:ribulokinase [Phyllobacterium sp. SYP-B3895]|uniref:FGGY-family carbohydrate kinase n=1 Tax=Phyllobacterium sp. SYP-B3895 TaxID=2663240 RepID=UPI0012997380|nr:FGGY-family carbohydrate kinase [Phyllobacterium sp. SYP-B3895]MRG57592.1 ribulokinase [Phyllobacterium sp. SYP-B3895]
MKAFLGIDVGTGSARAGVFDARGTLLGTGIAAIETLRPRPNFAQQSSAGVWRAVCMAVVAATESAGIAPASIVGIGFDATCSLVVVGETGKPVSVCPNSTPDSDIILWMDHRAIGDADEINAIGGEVLDYVGGRISPEMQMPKLRWLKRELPESWKIAATFWDLPDWLVHRATGTSTRSVCSAVCKWTYLGHKGFNGEGWDQEFLAAIGLGDLGDSDHLAIGNQFAPAGTAIGQLSETAAAELGLQPGIAVSSGMIDAYAGALGTLGVSAARGASLALIGGTSSCHIVTSEEPIFVGGVWGPYYSVLLPGVWASEGGQSAAGALIDAVIARHAASATLGDNSRPAEQLHRHLAAMADEPAFLTADRHLNPDFHGNRSPLAQAWRKGAVSGLTLDSDVDDLALDYLATIQALAYGTRHIIEEMQRKGIEVSSLVVSGGLAKNTLYLREHADATGCRVVVPAQSEPVLLGSAILGAVAAGAFNDIASAMSAMSGDGTVVEPRSGKIRRYHQAKYKVFRRMQEDFAAYAQMMSAEPLN